MEKLRRKQPLHDISPDVKLPQLGVQRKTPTFLAAFQSTCRCTASGDFQEMGRELHLIASIRRRTEEVHELCHKFARVNNLLSLGHRRLVEMYWSSVQMYKKLRKSLA